MYISNYFDLKFIVNLSVSITISLLIVFIFGKAVGDILSEMVKLILKNMGKSFIKRTFPVKFQVAFPLDRISPEKIMYEKHKVINFGKLSQNYLPGTGIDLFIRAESKLPFLYKDSKVRIQLVDSHDLLGIYGLQQLPGKPTTFILGELMYENNTICHMHIDVKPVKTVENYNIPINIFFEGKYFKNEVALTIRTD